MTTATTLGGNITVISKTDFPVKASNLRLIWKPCNVAATKEMHCDPNMLSTIEINNTLQSATMVDDANW